MAYDEGLAERVRDILAAAGQFPAEKKMFGGLSFLIGGNLCCGVRGDDLLVRVGPDQAQSALAEPATRPFEMGGRSSTGWIVVAPDGVTTDQALTRWVQRGVAVAATLPVKRR